MNFYDSMRLQKTPTKAKRSKAENLLCSHFSPSRRLGDSNSTQSRLRLPQIAYGAPAFTTDSDSLHGTADLHWDAPKQGFFCKTAAEAPGMPS